MVYECEHCGYSTMKNSNFLRHKNRKYPCYKTINGNNIENIEITNRNKNVNASVNASVNVSVSSVNADNNNKLYKCNICLKYFTTRQGRHNHKKNVKCHLPVQPIVNNITNNTTNTNSHNINSNVNSNNVNIVNVFGNEDLSYLSNDASILDKLRMFGKSGIYGLSKIIDDVHFNKERPENNTLIKPEEFGNGVMILNDDKEWEFREFEDIREMLLNTIMKYIKAYNIVKTNLGVRLVEQKEKKMIRNIAYEFMALDGVIPRDLFEELEMDEDDVEVDEEEIRSKLRKFDKSTLKKIHNKTISQYRKDNGNYIKKDY